MRSGLLRKELLLLQLKLKKRIYYDIGNKVVVIAIKDSGTGIDAKVFPKLFTKFASVSQGGT